MSKYKYFIWTNDGTSEENTLFATTYDVAIEFFNDLYLQIHDQKRSNVERIDLTDMDDNVILSYETHMGVLNVD